MNNGNYLIPANSKKSMLILGFFTTLDLIVFGIGVVLTFGMLVIGSQDNNIVKTIIILLPALISAFLVLPVPHYHNIMQLIINIIKFK